MKIYNTGRMLYFDDNAALKYSNIFLEHCKKFLNKYTFFNY